MIYDEVKACRSLYTIQTNLRPVFHENVTRWSQEPTYCTRRYHTPRNHNIHFLFSLSGTLLSSLGVVIIIFHSTQHVVEETWFNKLTNGVSSYIIEQIISDLLILLISNFLTKCSFWHHKKWSYFVSPIEVRCAFVRYVLEGWLVSCFSFYHYIYIRSGLGV
jgi:hypothetical protein